MRWRCRLILSCSGNKIIEKMFSLREVTVNAAHDRPKSGCVSDTSAGFKHDTLGCLCH